MTLAYADTDTGISHPAYRAQRTDVQGDRLHHDTQPQQQFKTSTTIQNLNTIHKTSTTIQNLNTIHKTSTRYTTTSIDTTLAIGKTYATPLRAQCASNRHQLPLMPHCAV